jgi:drug/metabolite transporter (DMT)-like permease
MMVALVLALVGAIASGGATLCETAAARRVGGLAAAVSGIALVGWLLDLGGWGVSLIAFDDLPLFVVEAILASQLVVVVLGEWAFFGRRPSRATLAVAGAVVAGLVVLALGSGDEPARAAAPAVVFACLVATAALVAAVTALYRHGPAWALAAVAGLGYSLAAIAARTTQWEGGVKAILLQPMLIPMAVGGLAGALAYLRALERAHAASAVAAISGVLEVIVPGTIGLLCLGDRVRPGWALPDLIAAAVSAVGCVVLSRAQRPVHEAVLTSGA